MSFLSNSLSNLRVRLPFEYSLIMSAFARNLSIFNFNFGTFGRDMISLKFILFRRSSFALLHELFSCCLLKESLVMLTGVRILEFSTMLLNSFSCVSILSASLQGSDITFFRMTLSLSAISYSDRLRFWI